jgi:hypothetical protein
MSLPKTGVADREPSSSPAEIQYASGFSGKKIGVSHGSRHALSSGDERTAAGMKTLN